MTTEKDKPREMSVPAIEKRFDAGSWDHADLVFLYARARLATELAAAAQAVIAEFFEEYEHEESAPEKSPTVKAIRRLQAAIRKAKGG